MSEVRNWVAKLEDGANTLEVTFHCPFYTECLQIHGGMLSRDFPAHALFDYYGCALQSYNRAKKNIVLETDLSLKFDVETARNLFQSIANKHGVSPADMVRYWPMIMRQQVQMGGTDHLPDVYKFHYWGN